MSELFFGGLAVITAVRVFVPDVVRLARRGLAAGVKVGAASLAERGRTAQPQRAMSPRSGPTGWRGEA